MRRALELVLCIACDPVHQQITVCILEVHQARTFRYHKLAMSKIVELFWDGAQVNTFGVPATRQRKTVPLTR